MLYAHDLGADQGADRGAGMLSRDLNCWRYARTLKLYPDRAVCGFWYDHCQLRPTACARSVALTTARYQAHNADSSGWNESCAGKVGQALSHRPFCAGTQLAFRAAQAAAKLAGRKNHARARRIAQRGCRTVSSHLCLLSVSSACSSVSALPKTPLLDILPHHSDRAR